MPNSIKGARYNRKSPTVLINSTVEIIVGLNNLCDKRNRRIEIIVKLNNPTL